MILIKLQSPFVLSLLSKIILIIIVNGTESSIPTGPKTHPQNINDTNTTKVDSPNPFPKIFTSRIEPNIVFAAKNPIPVNIAFPKPNCINAKTTGGPEASKEPMFGTKFNKKAFPAFPQVNNMAK